MSCETTGGDGTLEIAGDFGRQTPEGFILGGLCLDGRDVTDVFDSLRMPGIVSGLHSRPDSRAVAKKLAEPDRYGRGHRLPLLQDVVKMLARNPEQSGDFRLGPGGGRNN